MASTDIASDTTPQMAYEDISRSLPELEPITFQSNAEKHKLLVFIDNKCVYCSYVVKNIKKYTDAGLTMSFVTVAPSSIKDSVIEDMGRVWCASDRQKSLQNAMAGFLPGNDSSEKCKSLVIKQSALADRLGVEVTPAIVVLDKSAHIFLGSVPPEKILSELK
ncbi:thioredoxin fold domain-containing protein [Erwinia sp. INIA-01]|nr:MULTISPECIES: thioredoxin fold domain-containing protein [Erwiniaceae]MCW1875988.1 thioredoxin fold domain-containing protein [Erwinia sp. INIA01]